MTSNSNFKEIASAKLTKRVGLLSNVNTGKPHFIVKFSLKMTEVITNAIIPKGSGHKAGGFEPPVNTVMLKS